MDMFTPYGHNKKPIFFMILAWACPFKAGIFSFKIKKIGLFMQNIYCSKLNYLMNCEYKYFTFFIVILWFNYDYGLTL